MAGDGWGGEGWQAPGASSAQLMLEYGAAAGFYDNVQRAPAGRSSWGLAWTRLSRVVKLMEVQERVTNWSLCEL